MNIVENTRPQTIDVATGPQIMEDPPSPVAREKRPAIVVIEVISIGISLLLAAYTVACKIDIFSLTLWFAAEIKIIDELTVIPDSATMPYKVKRLSGFLVKNNPKITPRNAIGIVVSTRNGCQ